MQHGTLLCELWPAKDTCHKQLRAPLALRTERRALYCQSPRGRWGTGATVKHKFRRCKDACTVRTTSFSPFQSKQRRPAPPLATGALDTPLHVVFEPSVAAEACAA